VRGGKYIGTANFGRAVFVSTQLLGRDTL